MATFEQLKSWIQNSDVSQLGRTQKVTDDYKEFMSMVKQEWNSIDDYIMFRVFQGQFVIDEETGKRKVSFDPSEEKSPRASLVKNDFPYNVSHDVQHYVLWSTQRLDNEQVASTLSKLLPSKRYEVVWFENTPALKSVKNVWHAQVFSRAKQNRCVIV
uniref:HIT domain-containing protein n=1 Tax=Clandestinovirus TaxID=2831644 RepID=A0A8F8KPV6_9VIRU|nr:HIT domain-containing protein [Clandestinovirus]